jgi:hypothetical protein
MLTKIRAVRPDYLGSTYTHYRIVSGQPTVTPSKTLQPGKTVARKGKDKDGENEGDTRASEVGMRLHSGRELINLGI